MKPVEILLLSQKDIVSLDLTPDAVIGAVEQAMIEHSNGTYEMHPKIGVHPTGTDPDDFIHAMPAYLKKLGACGLKWVGGFAKNLKREICRTSQAFTIGDHRCRQETAAEQSSGAHHRNPDRHCHL